MDLLAFILAISADGITDEQVQTALNAYIAEHPEAVTTVTDGSITKAKLHDDLADEIEQNTADVSELKSAIEDLEAGSLSALGATVGQVPTADVDGSWEWATPSGGGGDVTDVQVNGVSVVQDGVANVPVADGSTLGVVKVDGTYGIGRRNDNYILTIRNAELSEIKAGNNYYKPITPQNQEASVFYGLAKAAGSDEKNSTLPAGQYTDAAKSAIQTMLGISGIIALVEGATASKAYAIGDAFLHGGALYKASAAIAAGDAIVPGTNCTQTTIIEMLKGA